MKNNGGINIIPAINLKGLKHGLKSMLNLW